jgi:hypothetical protein
MAVANTAEEKESLAILLLSRRRRWLCKQQPLHVITTEVFFITANGNRLSFLDIYSSHTHTQSHYKILLLSHVFLLVTIIGIYH